MPLCRCSSSPEMGASSHTFPFSHHYTVLPHAFYFDLSSCPCYSHCTSEHQGSNLFLTLLSSYNTQTLSLIFHSNPLHPDPMALLFLMPPHLISLSALSPQLLTNIMNSLVSSFHAPLLPVVHSPDSFAFSQPTKNLFIS